MSRGAALATSLFLLLFVLDKKLRRKEVGIRNSPMGVLLLRFTGRRMKRDGKSKATTMVFCCKAEKEVEWW